MKNLPDLVSFVVNKVRFKILVFQNINIKIITLTIGGPIQCVVSYRDQCAHKHTNMSLY